MKESIIWIKREQERLIKDLDDVKEHFTNFIDSKLLDIPVADLIKEEVLPSVDLEDNRQRINDACEDIKIAIEDLITENNDKVKQQQAFVAIASVEVLNSTVILLASHMNGIQPQTSRVGQLARKSSNWLKNYLKPIIKRISKEVWRLISRLLTPTSWTVQGQIGAGLFGIKSNVGISITFG